MWGFDSLMGHMKISDIEKGDKIKFHYDISNWFVGIVVGVSKDYKDTIKMRDSYGTLGGTAFSKQTALMAFSEILKGIEQGKLSIEKTEKSMPIVLY